MPGWRTKQTCTLSLNWRLSGSPATGFRPVSVGGKKKRRKEGNELEQPFNQKEIE
jgi:hypothetical protein